MLSLCSSNIVVSPPPCYVLKWSSCFSPKLLSDPSLFCVGDGVQVTKVHTRASTQPSGSVGLSWSPLTGCLTPGMWRWCRCWGTAWCCIRWSMSVSELDQFLLFFQGCSGEGRIIGTCQGTGVVSSSGTCMRGGGPLLGSVVVVLASVGLV